MKGPFAAFLNHLDSLAMSAPHSLQCLGAYSSAARPHLALVRARLWNIPSHQSITAGCGGAENDPLPESRVVVAYRTSSIRAYS
jgi:hypothetical protein